MNQKILKLLKSDNPEDIRLGLLLLETKEFKPKTDEEYFPYFNCFYMGDMKNWFILEEIIFKGIDIHSSSLYLKWKRTWEELDKELEIKK